jgi:hypothetical protein
MSFDADKAAASTFSPNIRRYSAGEHWFCAISIARRVMVSQDASIISAIIVETDVLLRLRVFIVNRLPWSITVRRVPNRIAREIHKPLAAPCVKVVIDGHGLLDESGSIVETVDVDHCADAGRGLANGADIDAAASAIRNSAVREPKR